MMRRWGGRRAQALTRAVLMRDQHRCHVPGCTRRATTADHTPIRRDQGGPDTMDNLKACCAHHNSSDGARYRNAKHAGHARIAYPSPRM
jgi:hypothetical protein